MDILFAQTSSNSSGSIYQLILTVSLMFFILYFIVIRPQSKERKEHEDELNSLTKGDRVISRGGIIGKIVEFQGKENEIIVIDTEYNNKFKIQKPFILKKIINEKENK